MSLILDALKKSEAQRRLGQAPGLLTPSPLAGPRRRRGPLLAAAVLATAVLAGGGWWWLQRHDGNRAAQPADVAGSNGRSAVAPAEPIATAAPDPHAPAQGRASRAPVAAAGDPPPTPAAATPAAQPTAAPAGQPARSPAAAPEPPPAAPLPQSPAFRSVEREARAMAAGADLPAAPAPAEPARVEPAAQAAAAVDPAAASTTESLPMLRDLPAEDRAALPPLKLSMHVYAVHPAERFVLVDGRRYSEGMAVANGLVLEEIRRDGVVLAFRGHRFVLQRPG